MKLITETRRFTPVTFVTVHTIDSKDSKGTWSFTVRKNLCVMYVKKGGFIKKVFLSIYLLTRSDIAEI